ncbi:DUF6735 family protein [Halomicrobium salinisoli]|uniref:DUF6735 family protein n=1 Tax=Halomicrobium salinisoli TaxID=2878391 RepID=UPI001CF0C2BC|nr:DUF6735 family protein [Halomicrobium salinisoli]
MGHRALVAYERPDSLYNIHYSHWGASNLRLKHAITPETPFGGEYAQESRQNLLTDLRTVDGQAEAETLIEPDDQQGGQVDVDPWAVGVTLDELLTSQLDYLNHEACYVVDESLDVTAFRTHWFGLQYDCRTVETSPTRGNGAIRTVRWYDGEPVGDGFAQGQFDGLKTVVGDMLDRGVFTLSSAREYLEAQLRSWVGCDDTIHVRTPP